MKMILVLIVALGSLYLVKARELRPVWEIAIPRTDGLRLTFSEDRTKVVVCSKTNKRIPVPAMKLSLKDTIIILKLVDGSTEARVPVPVMAPAFVIKDTLYLLLAQGAVESHPWPSPLAKVSLGRFPISNAGLVDTIPLTTVFEFPRPVRITDEVHEADYDVDPVAVIGDSAFLFINWFATSWRKGPVHSYRGGRDLELYSLRNGESATALVGYENLSTYRENAYLSVCRVKPYCAHNDPLPCPDCRWRVRRKIGTRVIEHILPGDSGTLSLSPSGRIVIDNGYIRDPISREAIVPAINGVMLSDIHSVAIRGGKVKVFDNRTAQEVLELKTDAMPRQVLPGPDSTTVFVLDDNNRLALFNIGRLDGGSPYFARITEYQSLYTTEDSVRFRLASSIIKDSIFCTWYFRGEKIGTGETCTLLNSQIGLANLKVEIDIERNGSVDTSVEIARNFIHPFATERDVLNSTRPLRELISVVRAVNGDSSLFFGTRGLRRGSIVPGRSLQVLDDRIHLRPNAPYCEFRDIEELGGNQRVWLFGERSSLERGGGQAYATTPLGIVIDTGDIGDTSLCVQTIDVGVQVGNHTASERLFNKETWAVHELFPERGLIFASGGIDAVLSYDMWTNLDPYGRFAGYQPSFELKYVPELLQVQFLKSNDTASISSVLCQPIRIDRFDSTSVQGILSMAYRSADSSLYVSGWTRRDGDRRVGVYKLDAYTRAVKHRFVDQSSNTTLHPSQHFLQTGNYLWNLTNNTIADSFGVKRRFEYFPDGVHIAYLDSGRLSIVNTKTRALVQKYSFLYPISAFTLTPNWTLWAGTENGYLLQLRIPREKMQIQRDDGIGLASADTSLVVGSAVTFYNKARALFGGDTFAWQVEGGKAGAGRVFTTTFREPGWYTIRMTVRDSSGAATEYKSAVYVRGLPMSVEESSLEAPSLELLGNPSEGLIHVSTNAPTIRIWSSAGELLYAGEASKPLPAHAGTYLVEAISASGTKLTRKAVVY